ncbi:hypothetical protein NUBL13799_06140 [Klebsiella pneumoniae]|nr:hypothetical protein NUBL13799_06140 [Klebsiella pneumoniae]GKO41954.1 hypothetical protein NUBL17192_38730 [Klebsiella pneumoniae]
MLYVNPQILIVAEIVPVGVVAADSALQFHVEATIPLGGEDNTNDIASISDRKAGELAIAKNRSAIGFVDDFRQLADAVKHKQQLGKQRARRAKASLAICREKTCGLMTGR